MNEARFRKVPAKAFAVACGEVELAGSADNKGKTSPVRLKARSGQPIEHWFWGKVVHDLTGMRLHKPRLPIDYAHNDAEVLGYLNKFDSTSGDLVASGALIPFRPDDRASEVLHKMREGVPYEASIFFGGDGIKIQELAEGEVADVNGYRLQGPAVIVREWPLRGVAICPYGADMNTDSAASFASGKEIAVEILKNEIEETQMAETQVEAAEAASPPVEESAVQETPAPAVETETSSPVEAEAAPEADAKPVVEEEPPAADEVPAEVTAVEAEVVEDPQPEPEQSAPVDPRYEFKRMCADFGQEIAAQVFADGGGYDAAREAYYKAIEAENKALKAKVAALPSGGTPAAFVVGDKPAEVDENGVHRLFRQGTRRNR